ncbi:hypothetical protein J6590_008563 [Homalodisca vitripennis]|nr:hypothetical protein J6590_008563 [Homalodisca vitripennis]
MDEAKEASRVTCTYYRSTDLFRDVAGSATDEKGEEMTVVCISKVAASTSAAAVC